MMAYKFNVCGTAVRRYDAEADAITPVLCVAT